MEYPEVYGSIATGLLGGIGFLLRRHFKKLDHLEGERVKSQAAFLNGISNNIGELNEAMKASNQRLFNLNAAIKTHEVKLAHHEKTLDGLKEDLQNVQSASGVLLSVLVSLAKHEEVHVGENAYKIKKPK